MLLLLSSDACLPSGRMLAFLTLVYLPSDPLSTPLLDWSLDRWFLPCSFCAPKEASMVSPLARRKVELS